MKANHPHHPAWLLVSAAALALSGCAAPVKPAPPPPVVIEPIPRPVAVTPPPLPVPPADWRDAPQSAGTWRWSLEGGRSTASFGPSPGAPLVTLRCERGSGQILLARTGSGEGHVALSLTTTTGTRPLLSEPLLSAPGWLVVPLRVRDPILDAMAFSRGRFMIEASGQPPLYLPAWTEVSRVIEDCR